MLYKYAMHVELYLEFFKNELPDEYHCCGLRPNESDIQIIL